MSAAVASAAIKEEKDNGMGDLIAAEGEQAGAQASSSSRASQRPPLPSYFPCSTSKPSNLPTAHLNGTQDMLSLFGLMPLYDRAVRPYNPDTIKAAGATGSGAVEAATGAEGGRGASSSTSGAFAAPSGAAGAGANHYDGAGQSSGQASAGGFAASTPRAGGVGSAGIGVGSMGATVGAGAGTQTSHQPSSTSRISTPALQLNGGPPSFSLPTDSSAILAASPGQIAASAASAPPARKPTKPPPTYAHYVEDLAGRVRPPRKAARAARADKGTSLLSILFKPEYTPQNIVPFDRETLEAAFRMEPGEVPEIDQAQLEPDEEEAPRPKKKKKKNRSDAGGGGSASGNAGYSSVPPPPSLPTSRR